MDGEDPEAGAGVEGEALDPDRGARLSLFRSVGWTGVLGPGIRQRFAMVCTPGHDRRD